MGLKEKLSKSLFHEEEKSEKKPVKSGSESDKERNYEDFNIDELRKEYDFLQEQYEKVKSEKTRKMIEVVADLINNYKEKPEEDLDEHQKKVLEKCKQLANAYGKNLEGLDEHTKKQLVSMAENAVSADEKMKEMSKPDDPERKRAEELEKIIQEHIDRETELKNKIGEMNQQLIDQDKKLTQLEHQYQLTVQNSVRKDAMITDLKRKLSEKQKPVQGKHKPVQEKEILATHSKSSQIAYRMLQKKKQEKPFKKELKGYELKSLDLYCLACKHSIQTHARGGVSNGCNKCGCLRTIEDIAKENNMPLITRKEYQEIRKETKKPMIDLSGLKKQKGTAKIITDEPKENVDETIVKQAEKLATMGNPKKDQRKLRAEEMQRATQIKLKKDAERKSLMKDKTINDCTCGHVKDQHFETGFCTEKGCPCEQFKEYPV